MLLFELQWAAPELLLGVKYNDKVGTTLLHRRGCGRLRLQLLD